MNFKCRRSIWIHGRGIPTLGTKQSSRSEGLSGRSKVAERDEAGERKDTSEQDARFPAADVEFQTFPESIDVKSDQRQKVFEDEPATDLNEDLLHRNLREIDTVTASDADINIHGTEESQIQQVVTITSNGPSCLSGTQKEIKNDSTAEYYGQNALTNIEIHTNGVCPVEFTSLQAMAVQTKDEKTEEDVMAPSNIFDKLFQDYVNKLTIASKANDLEGDSHTSACRNVDVLSIGNDRVDVKHSTENPSEKIKDALVEIRHESVSVTSDDDECGSIASSSNTEIYEEAVCEDMEMEAEEETEEAIIDMTASADVRFQSPKSNRNGSKDNSSIVVKKNQFSVETGVVYEDEVSSHGSQSPIVTQTLLFSYHSEARKAIPLPYSRQSHHDLGASSTFRRHFESTQSAKLPPGSTLIGNKGVFHIKDKEKPFACGYCGKAYRKKRAVYFHIICQHDEKRYSCEFCGKRFAEPSLLARHIVIHRPTQEKPFTCEQCGKQFRLKSSLHRHKTHTHSEERLFSCNQCNKSFKTRDSLSRHNDSHKMEEQRKGVTCDICKRKFAKPYLLKEHMTIHTGEKPFKCPLCEKQFCLKAYLRDHMNIHQDTEKLADKPESACVPHTPTQVRNHSGEKPHMTIRSDEAALPNSLLEEEIQLKARLLNHPISSSDGHVGLGRITNSDKFCNEVVSDCEVAIVRESRIQNTTETISRQSHTRGHSSNTVIGKRVSVEAGIVYEDEVSSHGSQSPIVTQTLLSSDHSEATKAIPFPYSRQSHHDLSASSTFRRHIGSTQSAKLPPGSILIGNKGVFRIKDKEKPFACGYCGKAYRKKRSVYLHIICQHDEKRYSCEFCGKRFAEHSFLAKHIRIHSQEKPFTCEQCGKQFRLNASLHRHKIHTHSEKRLFSCNQCNKSFKTRDALSKHKESRKTEEQKKGVTCDICKRKFAKPYLLKEHMTIHTGEKPFKCPLCEKQFCLKAYLRDHMNIHQDTEKLADKPESACVPHTPTQVRNHSGEKPHMTIRSDEAALPNSLLEEEIQLKARLLNHPISSSDGHVGLGRITNSDKFCNEVVSDCEVAIVRESRIQNTTETISRQSHTRGHSSNTVIGKRVSVEVGIVYEDEVSSHGSQSPIVTQTLLSSDHSEATKAIPFPYSRQSHHDLSASSTFRKHLEPTQSAKLPPGSTLLSNRGVFRIKDKEKPFACGYCGKAYKRKSVVYCHIRHQHVEKRYSCEFCGKRFAEPSLLAMHTTIHTQEKPLSCDECGKQFRFRSSLCTHKYTHSVQCNKCNKSFKSRKNFAIHKESHKKEEQRKGVTCDICKRKFAKPYLLKEHMTIHTGEKPFKCPLCEKQFCLKAYLRDHMNIHQDTEKLADEPEPVCVLHTPTQVRNHSGEKPHMTIRSDEAALKSSLLEEEIQLKAGLLNHPISSSDGHVSGIANSDKFCNEDVSDCEVAIVRESRIQNTTETISIESHRPTKGYSSKTVIGKRVSVEAGIVYEDEVSSHGSQSPIVTRTLLSSDHSEARKAIPLSYSRQSHHDLGASSTFRKHFESTQSAKLPPGSTFIGNKGVFRIKDKEKPFACGYCGKAYRKKRAVYLHIICQHDEKRYSCEFCGKRFAEACYLAKHIRIHSQEKPFTCDQCGKQFRLNASLHSHKTHTHSEERLFSCNQCNKSFKTRDALSRHNDSHKMEEQRKGVACDICKRKFRIPFLLKEHMMIHTGEKPFKCTLCEKQFRLKTSLLNHMNYHSGKNRTACSVCGKTLWANHMPDHMRMHAGVKPFECNVCGKRFPKKQNLEGHMRSHTGEKPFACDRCDKRFALYSNMVTHKAKCSVISGNVV